MKKTIILLLFCLLTVNVIVAQNYKFGKVSKEELESKVHKKDSSAVASVLYEDHRSYVEYFQNQGFMLITTVHKRIKIYDEKGFGYGTDKVFLYNGDSDKEKISSIKGYTYNLEKGKVKDTKLSKDGIFENEESQYWNSETFTFPNLKEGSVIEYEYKIISPFLTNVREVQIQREIPVDKLDAKFEFPEYFYFKPQVKGFYLFKVDKSAKNGSINFTTKNRQPSGWSSGPTSFSNNKVSYIINVNSISVEDVPALKDEPYVNNIDNYRASIDFELSYVKFPNESTEYYSTTWEAVAKKIYEYDGFGDELKKTRYYESAIDALMAKASNTSEKIGLIYTFVKNKMAWNKNNGFTCDNGVRKAYKESTGNVADINLMLTSMLNYAGVEAYPVLVSTRSHGIPLFPTQDGFNYVIAVAKINDAWVTMDATDKYASPNILPERALNWMGRIIRKDGNSMQIDLTPKHVSKRLVFMNVNLSEEGDVEGKIRRQYFDHNAFNFRARNNHIDGEEYLESLENKLGGIEVNDYKVDNKLDIQKPVVEQFGFYKESACDMIGDKMYLSPLLFYTEEENPFKLEKREFPIDFSYPTKDQLRINVKIPEGYKIESMPEPVKLALPDNIGNFLYHVAESAGVIQLLVDFEINTAIVPSLYYETIKQYFSTVVEKETEKIVLSQI
ncbi:DUF3857 domain-containing protein [Galbibacter sp. EGI 63066]|uniref:DUF3857 domain-containing protein n=1 Tax=Galbibacter sp. EGI 63066 TaxID=2993559 RepID=UPI002248C58A|nr:DUF3857 domain-containing protein [Galbibacter sp. EGI 63066]MCX2680421.1 DUF3857 domain-containing protein [Galbibacter sp. EGI 63066]